jgi:hypothetical protein
VTAGSPFPQGGVAAKGAGVRARAAGRVAAHEPLDHRRARRRRVAGRDAGAVRDDIRGFDTAHLGHPQAVLVAGETGDLKKGTATTGMQRQYAGTAGQTGNAQVAVYLS